jgi:hypothetical protein
MIRYNRYYFKEKIMTSIQNDINSNILIKNIQSNTKLDLNTEKKTKIEKQVQLLSEGLFSKKLKYYTLKYDIKLRNFMVPATISNFILASYNLRGCFDFGTKCGFPELNARGGFLVGSMILSASLLSASFFFLTIYQNQIIKQLESLSKEIASDEKVYRDKLKTYEEKYGLEFSENNLIKLKGFFPT